MPRAIAAMDLGTNSFHLAVVQPDDQGRFEILSTEKEAVRLGSGGGDLNLILPDAMERGLTVLKRFTAISRSMNADIRAVATSAVREAKNSAEFLERVKKECGLDVEVIPGKEEARLIYLGILQCLPVYDKRVLTIDIGGGSTEYLVGKSGIPEFAVSLKLGAIRLKDRFFPGGVVTDKAVSECRQFVRIALTGARDETKSRGYEMAIGSSGTIETLWDMIRLRKKIPELAEPVIHLQDLDRVVDDILSIEGPEKRAKLDGLDEKRADIIVGGAILIQESARLLGISALYFSRYALREGVVFDALQRKSDHALGIPDVRRSSVDRLAESFARVTQVVHAPGVVNVAARLFDEVTATRPGIGTLEDRFLLECAAKLHNVGVAISHGSHHKHSYYIIRNSDLLGFSPIEIELIALVARYHRKGEPKQNHPEYGSLAKSTQSRVYN
ncbi:MAG TPA: Ppx/GppA phosphatase family protein, partial [Leptospiraceae bacterium]|nr:Ppx/GppA phosphatase family protein [Leptospiraceae bacterium]